ncbi:MAG: MG2 domain-containing protein [Deltaproteobacteria bacterium]|nr:MG2 domain-containing protein [Deltaproteobacteria bacterium]
MPSKDRAELELSPLPQPPAVDVAGGTLPGVPAGPLTVVVARPQERLRGNERPALTFNKPVVPLGAADEDMPVPATITPAVAGAWRWIGSAAVEFQPTEPFPYATTFTVLVKPELKAIDGQPMKAPFSFSFSTLPPAVERSVPERGWAWLDPALPILVTFNQPVKNLEKARLTAGDKPVPFKIGKVVDVDEEQAKKAGRRPAGRTPWGRPTRYELSAKIPADAVVRLDLDDVVGSEGPLGVDGSASLEWHSRGPMVVKLVKLCGEYSDNCPSGPVVLHTSNEVDPTSLTGRVHIKKKGDNKDLEIDVDDISQHPDVQSARYAVYVPARLQPGTAYDVVIDAGVADDQGQKAAAFSGSVKTSDVDPWFSVSAPFVLLEKSGDGALPVETANLARVQATITPLTVADMARLLADDGDSSLAGGKAVVPAGGVDVVLDIPLKKNTFQRTPLPLRPHLPTDGPQLFSAWVRADERKEFRVPTRLLGQITDLAAHAKLGALSSVVWVTSLSTGQPVSGAVVRVHDAQGSLRAEAVTDKDGIAKLAGMVDVLGKDGDSEDNWHVPFALVSATKDADTGVTLSSWSGDGDSAPHAWAGNIPDVDVTAFAERGIYRPGEQVYVKGVVRSRVRGELSVPKPDSELKISFTDNDGKTLKEERVPLTKFGTFSTTATLPKDASLGWWGVRISGTLKGKEVGGSTSFRVEQYRAPQFKVDLQGPSSTSGPSALVSGDALTATVNARYLFGAPMPGASVDATVTRETSDFSAAGEDDFSFGVSSWWWDDDEPRPSSDVYARSRGVIGDDGTFVVDAGAVEASAGRTWLYTVEAEVKDVSRQTVADRVGVVVHPAAVYAGVRVVGGFGEVGKETPIELVAVAATGDTAGKRVSGTPIDVVIRRREWKSVRKKDEDLGRFVTMSEPVETEAHKCAGLKSGAEPATCAFTADKPGLHIVEATATDDKGRKQRTKTSFYVSGDGWVSWQRGDDDSLELVADKKVYAPGDTAKVLIKSPWPAAEAIVTTEREGVRTVRRFSLKGAATAVDVPIDDTAIPNIYVSAVLVRGRVGDVDGAKDAAKGEVDPGRPQVKIGLVNLQVEKTHKRLDVAIDAGPGTKRPGQKLSLKLAVSDFKKAGVPAEVTLWAVDEAVLRLTDYTPPDLLQRFHPQRGLSVRFGEPLIHLVKKQAYGGKGDPGGGGGGDAGAGFRSNFKTTAFFVPDIITDDQGNATVDVMLPDDLTTYRLMAIAVADDRFGGGKSEIVVQKPVMVLPSLPRLVRVGDVFEAGVVVHSSEAGAVVVTADATGLSLTGARQSTVTLAGKGVEARFAFRAEKPGTATFMFKATRGSESDGLKLSIPVYLPVVVETTAVSGMTDDSRTEALSPPGDARTDIGGLEVSLGSTALSGYGEAMKQLVDYPHGCLEQLASKLVPFLALRELQGGFGITHKAGSDDDIKLVSQWLGASVLNKDGTPEPDKVIEATLARIAALQDSGSGGFRYWPESSCVDPWASSYATLSLVRAQELGLYGSEKGVKKDVVDGALKFLSDRVLADSLPSCGWGPRHATTAERVFAGFVLSRAGKPKLGNLGAITTEILQKPESQPLFVRALLADALVTGKGDPATAQKVLQTVLNAARETPREVHFEEPEGAQHSALRAAAQAYWSSDVRTSAIVLMTLVDAVPEHPFIPKLAAYLQTARLKSGQYRNTQEASFALMALTEVTRTKERDPPSFNATVSLGAAPLVTESFKGRNLDVVTMVVPMAEVLAKGTSDLPFTFKKEGAGTLYYSALLRRAPTTMPTNALDRGFVVQRWFEPIDNAKQQGRTFYAGDLVRVRVRVATKDARRYVAVDVPLPAGLEAIDTSLATTANAGGARDDTQSEGDEGEEEGESDDDGFFFWSPFSHSEKRDDRVSYYADELPPGVHTLTFVTRATTMGTFLLAPAEASEMYAPEVFGRSDAGNFKVVP